MSAFALVLVTLTSLLLFVYGINLLYLSRRALSLRPEAVRSVAAGEELPVVVQLPVYNERYVAERVIDAACRLDWPRDRLEIQVLDDSDDETVAIVQSSVSRWRARGVKISACSPECCSGAMLPSEASRSISAPMRRERCCFTAGRSTSVSWRSA